MFHKGILLTMLVKTVFSENWSSGSEHIIHHVNNANTTWLAGYNFHPNLKLSDFKKRLGARSLQLSVLPLKSTIVLNNNIPEEFDAREQWPYCASISEIHDQGACGSCWTVAAVDAFTDRICIANGGSWEKYKHISAEDLLSCCWYCGDCSSGSIEWSWYYFQQCGVVTGGYYQSREGCRPYSFQPCEHYVNGSRVNCEYLRPVDPPDCKRTCFTDHINYDEDKQYVSNAYEIYGESDMLQEIMNYGPITALFRVYEDFPHYKTGVYQHVYGRYINDNLAVRLIGWGIDQGTPYWLAANSFNNDWGDEGYFKILRSQNECGIEENVFAGIPSNIRSNK